MRVYCLAVGLSLILSHRAHAQWCAGAQPTCNTGNNTVPAPLLPVTQAATSVQTLFQAAGVPKSPSLATLADHNTSFSTARSEFSSEKLGSGPRSIKSSDDRGITLGDPLVNFKFEVSVTGLAGRLEANLMDRSKFSDWSNYSANLPIGPATVEMGSSGIRSIGLGIGNPLLIGVEVGTNINSGINAYVSANMFNTKVKVTASPGVGLYNATGALEHALYDISGVPWPRY